jgi:3-hydroxyisobutyrate dehydrogenase-like beta-hydroxyacid dehydrogenase
MLPDDKSVEDVISNVFSQGKIIINMGTISVDCAKELSRKARKEGWDFVNAPVSGSKKPAEDGELVILYGGKKELLLKLEFAFKAMGKAIIEAGSPEDSAKLKLIVNFLMAGMLESLAESMAISKKLGISHDTLLRTIEQGVLNCPMVRMKGKGIMENNFEPAFATKYILKDLRYLEKEAQKTGYSIRSNVVELYGQSDRKYSDKDLSVIYRLFSSS